jgi:hypothetical protein
MSGPGGYYDDMAQYFIGRRPNQVTPSTVGPNDGQTAGQQNAAPEGQNAALGGALNFTPIKDHPVEKSPLTETRTVMHEFTGYLSLNNIGTTIKETQGGVVNGFYLNMNNLFQIVETTFVPQPTGASNLNPTFGPSITRQNEGYTYGSGSGATAMWTNNGREDFPRRFVGTGNVGNKALEEGICQENYGTWVRWYQKMYRYYHHMETNFKITVQYANFNADVDKRVVEATGAELQESGRETEGTRRRHVYIAHHPESYVQDNQSDIYPNQIVSVGPDGNQIVRMIGLHQLKKFKNVKIQEVQNPKLVNHGANCEIVITGTWMPGKREGSVRNLEDIKQWYPTGAPPTGNWRERESFYAITAADSCRRGNVNVKIEVSHKVQYKDLREIIKYAPAPTHIGQACCMRFGIDDVQFPYPLENHLVAPYNPAVDPW